MKKILTLCFLFITIFSLAQKPKSGIYVCNYYDEEYKKSPGEGQAIYDSLLNSQ